MTKKKIIAIGSTAASLLLIAGIGVATWAITSSNGSVKTPGNDIDAGLTPPEYTDADWGTMTINNANNFKVAFDQNQILFTSGMTANADYEGYYDLPQTTTHLTATWTLKNSTDTAPNLLNGDVEFYAYIYLNNTTQVGSEYLTDYVDFVTSGSGTAWDAVNGAAKQVTSAVAVSGEEVLSGYTGYKYKLAVGTSTNMGVTVPTNTESAPDWKSGSITLTINLDNLFAYKSGKFTEANLETDIDAFKTVLDGVSSPVKVYIEAKSKASN